MLSDQLVLDDPQHLALEFCPDNRFTPFSFLLQPLCDSLEVRRRVERDSKGGAFGFVVGACAPQEWLDEDGRVSLAREGADQNEERSEKISRDEIPVPEGAWAGQGSVTEKETNSSDAALSLPLSLHEAQNGCRRSRRHPIVAEDTMAEDIEPKVPAKAT